MPGNLAFNELESLVKNGAVDTVISAFPDMQGRLVGKRFHASHFMRSAWRETHCCDYLIATDMEMTPVSGYAASNWKKGYGDYVLKPDLETLRTVPWLEKTVLVLGDLFDHHGHGEIAHSPRAVLKKQVERLKRKGFVGGFACELEFFVFHNAYRELLGKDYRNLQPVSPYIEDYHVFQTTKEEPFMRKLRNALYEAGIPVENTKGEAGVGQAEINFRHSDPLDTADNATIVKNAAKEIAWSMDMSVTFMAKWNSRDAGSSGHIHQSLQTSTGKPVFFAPENRYGMSKTMERYLAGLLQHADETTCFLAPYVNSYKRFVKNVFAPVQAIWSADNRTAGYRVIGGDTENVRIECRIGGSDINPYLAFAGQIAAGLAGIDDELELEPETRGNAYENEAVRKIPGTLALAADRLEKSRMLREALGTEVVDHYVRAARWEQEEFEVAVTDYELRRGFERA